MSCLECGRTLFHYRILERLGAGGMGEVYRAEDLRLGREVALKVLREDAAREAPAIERFGREARAASSLDHPNVCTVYDVGEQEGRRVIVMELLDGRPLHELIDGHPLRLARLLEIGIAVADALEAAHEKGILHRDRELLSELRQDDVRAHWHRARALGGKAGRALSRAIPDRRRPGDP